MARVGVPIPVRIHIRCVHEDFVALERWGDLGLYLSKTTKII